MSEQKNEVAVFEKQYLAAFKQLGALAKQKKEIEKQEKEVKTALEEAMNLYDIVGIKNDYITISRVAHGKDSVSIDLKKLEEKEPELYKDLLKDYPKVTKGKAGYIKFTVK